MKSLVLAAMATLTLAAPAAAGNFGYATPHLTWPEPTPAPEVPTRLCGSPVVQSELCAPAE